MNENSLTRYLKTKDGLKKDEVIKYEYISTDLYWVSIENDTVKCGNPLIVRIMFSGLINSEFIHNSKVYSPTKNGNSFKLKINTSCANKGVHVFKGVFNVKYGVSNEKEANEEVEFSYVVR